MLKATEEAKTEAAGRDRRKFPRHQYIREIEVRRIDGVEYSTMSFEISQGGISLATPRDLQVGDLVEVYPVVGRWVAAIVRRKSGAMHGLEFIGLTDGERKRIEDECKGLPLFQSMASI